MRFIILFSFLIFISFKSFGQEHERLFGGQEINIRVLFISPYYELGEDRINHFGLGGGVSVYKRFFIGAYKQWGNWVTNKDENNFQSHYSHGGFWLGNIIPIKKSKFSIVTSCYLGKGKSTSEQSVPIAFSDAKIQFNIVTPEIGIEYRFFQLGTILLSTGYHSYSRTDENDLPVGFDGFELNQYYAKLGFRIGV